MKRHLSILILIFLMPAFLAIIVGCGSSSTTSSKSSSPSQATTPTQTGKWNTKTLLGGYSTANKSDGRGGVVGETIGLDGLGGFSWDEKDMNDMNGDTTNWTRSGTYKVGSGTETVTLTDSSGKSWTFKIQPRVRQVFGDTVPDLIETTTNTLYKNQLE